MTFRNHGPSATQGTTTQVSSARSVGSRAASAAEVHAVPPLDARFVEAESAPSFSPDPGGVLCAQSVRSLRSGVRIVPVPPLIRRGLGIAIGRVLPHLLTPERSDVEVA